MTQEIRCIYLDMISGWFGPYRFRLRNGHLEVRSPRDIWRFCVYDDHEFCTLLKKYCCVGG